MKYEVELCVRQDDRTVTIEAASPQLAAKEAQREYPVLLEVAKVDGMECLGKCLVCERHVFAGGVFVGGEGIGITPDGEVLCRLCKKNLLADSARIEAE